VYIALPNSMHAEYTIRAAKAGVHVLCEKPMAVAVNECQRMIRTCRKHRVKLMIAYRLHFEEINLEAIELIRQGRIGDPKFFNSSFSMTVRAGNIRTQAKLGGGTLYDIGLHTERSRTGTVRRRRNAGRPDCPGVVPDCPGVVSVRKTGRAVAIASRPDFKRPNESQIIRRPGIRKPDLVKAASASEE
jgi:hypothetical protein